MSALDDARSAAAQAQQALDAANLVISDLEAEPTTGGGEPVDFTAQAITNADGSVVVTLTPTAPAAVSDAAAPAGGDGSGDSPSGVVTSDTGTDAEPELAPPGPTG